MENVNIVLTNDQRLTLIAILERIAPMHSAIRSNEVETVLAAIAALQSAK